MGLTVNGAAQKLVTGTLYVTQDVVAIGTTDLDGTPAVGALTVQADNNDGSSNVFVGRDSDGVNVLSVNDNGKITTANTIQSGIGGFLTLQGQALHSSVNVGDIIPSTYGQTLGSIAINPFDTNRFVLISSDMTVDYGHTQKADATLILQSDDNTDITKYGERAWNYSSLGLSKGGFYGTKTIEEEVTIAATEGTGGITTSGNLAPAGAQIKGIISRVTQAPGGGATTYDIGITGSGNVDELADGVSTALDTTSDPSDNDGTQYPIQNGAATTLTITTDGDVTGASLIIRVGVIYEYYTPFTS